jgi:hypothetical protein
MGRLKQVDSITYNPKEHIPDVLKAVDAQVRERFMRAHVPPNVRDLVHRIPFGKQGRGFYKVLCGPIASSRALARIFASVSIFHRMLADQDKRLLVTAGDSILNTFYALKAGRGTWADACHAFGVHDLQFYSKMIGKTFAYDLLTDNLFGLRKMHVKLIQELMFEDMDEAAAEVYGDYRAYREYDHPNKRITPYINAKLIEKYGGFDNPLGDGQLPAIIDGDFARHARDLRIARSHGDTWLKRVKDNAAQIDAALVQWIEKLEFAAAETGDDVKDFITDQVRKHDHIKHILHTGEEL